jgi:phosphate starvation-inducible PhoH-like protein
LATKKKSVIQKPSPDVQVSYKGTKTLNTNILNFNSYVAESKQKSKIEIIPKSLKQEEYIDLLTNIEKPIVFATGPAGSGKTMLAVLAALKALREGSITKIIITRPAVEVDGEKHGFLPGTLNEKMEPWTKPIFDVMKEYYSPRELMNMLENEVIEIAPLAFLRGRTFKHAYIIADEMQNAGSNSMKMLLTRIGDNSRMFITGDLQQNDRKYVKDNGLREFLDMLKQRNSSLISFVEFSKKDVMRHPVVKEVLEMYGEC